MYKRIINLCLVMLMLIFSCTANVSAKESSVPNIAYKSHVQNIGWMEAVNSGITSGTTGKGYRLEAMKIQLIQNGKSMVRYRTHVQNIGWQDWVDSDKVT